MEVGEVTSRWLHVGCRHQGRSSLAKLIVGKLHGVQKSRDREVRTVNAIPQQCESLQIEQYLVVLESENVQYQSCHNNKGNQERGDNRTAIRH